MKLRNPIIISLLMVGLVGCSDHGSTSNITDPPIGADPISLATDVQPILDTNCVFCHGAGGSGGLDLRSGLSHENLLGVAANNSSGNLVTAGDALSSVLYQRMVASSSPMPPSGSLPLAITSVLRQWIDEGAFDN